MKSVDTPSGQEPVRTISDQIGNTPMVRISCIPGDVGVQIHVKPESNSPAGSVKDRPAFNMIFEAERRVELSPGDRLIEATSGNTGT